ncbi:MAG: sensor histidine kinase [Acidimicrobiia bacterium]
MVRPYRWTIGVHRLVLAFTAGGGLLLGLLLILLSSRIGVTSSMVVGCLSVLLGAAAAIAYIRDVRQSLPFLVAVPILIGAIAPFIDGQLALALDAVLIGVLGAGVLLIENLRRMWLFVALVLMAAAADPLLLGLGIPDHPISLPGTPGMGLAIVGTALVMSAASYRSIRNLLARREQLRHEMDQFVSAVAHNLRTPLTAVVGFAQLLVADIDTSPQQEYAYIVARRAWEMSDGVDDLIVVARSAADSLQILLRPVSLRAEVDLVLEGLPQAVEKLTYADVHGVVIGDRTRVRQIIRHLISNATEHGGPHILLSTKQERDTINFYVHDDGPPLDPTEQQRIFEPYYRAPYTQTIPGRGIGLTVSSILARAMGGNVIFHGDPSGNIAALQLPAHPATPDPAVADLHARARLQRLAQNRNRPAQTL